MGLRTGGIVLAAGGGTRFGGEAHKLRTPFRGRPLVCWAVDAAREAGLPVVVVVTGAVPLDDLLPDDVVVVRNDRWQDGIATSVRVGIGEASERGCEAVVVGPADQPLVPASAWRAVAAVEDAAVAVATYGGQRRNPVRLARAAWSLLPVTGDEGARALMRGRPDLVREVACEGEPADVDTVEDLRAWS